ncbi:hypothetical protein ACM6XU_004705 [Vibrio parahaemolyticus]
MNAPPQINAAPNEVKKCAYPRYRFFSSFIRYRHHNVWSTYFAINQIKHPQLEPWITDPVKPRNFIFEALVDFLKIELVLVPFLYALLSLISYEQDERNQASLMQLLVTFSHYTWCYWLMTKSVCAYKKQATTIDKTKDDIIK